MIFWLLPIVILLLSTEEERCYFIICLTKITAYILLISLIAYFFVIFGKISFPWREQFDPSNEGYGYFKNYIFFLAKGDMTLLTTRFQSVFREPGHLGTYCAILLYINNYTIKKWQNIVFYLSLVFSFSLGGYILLICGVLLFHFARSKNKIKTILKLTVVISFAFVFIFYIYKNYPDSLLSTRILSRVFSSDTNGLEFSEKYNSFIYNFDIKTFTGWGNSVAKDIPGFGNSSYKNYIYDYGILGVFLLCLMYGSFIIGIGTNSLLCVCLFFLYIASFIQRPKATDFYQVTIFLGYCSMVKSNRIDISNPK